MEKTVNLTCECCNHQWTWKNWEFILHSLRYFWNLFFWKGYRYIKCPKCRQASWIVLEK